jgi:hypothetical protein
VREAHVVGEVLGSRHGFNLAKCARRRPRDPLDESECGALRCRARTGEYDAAVLTRPPRSLLGAYLGFLTAKLGFPALFMDVWVVGGLGGWVWGLRGSASRGR